MFHSALRDLKKAGSKASFIPSLQWHNPFDCFVIVNIEKQHTILCVFKPEISLNLGLKNTQNSRFCAVKDSQLLN